MKTGVLIGALLLLLSPTAAHAESERVVVVGDSITGGAGTFDPARYAWPTRLGFERSTTNGGCIVTSGCFGGVSPAVATYDTDVLAASPDVVVIAFGINDITANDVRMVDILAGMEEMAAKNDALGIETYVATVTPVRGTRFRWFDMKRRALNRLIRDRFGDHVIDFDHALVAKSGRLQKQYDSGDKLHPNAHAYSVMAKVAAAAMLG